MAQLPKLAQEAVHCRAACFIRKERLAVVQCEFATQDATGKCPDEMNPLVREPGQDFVHGMQRFMGITILVEIPCPPLDRPQIVSAEIRVQPGEALSQHPEKGAPQPGLETPVPVIQADENMPAWF